MSTVRFDSELASGYEVAFYWSKPVASVYAMYDNGTNLRSLFPSFTAFNPAWSPDGSKIAFVSDKDGNAELYVASADGKNIRRLTYTPWTELYPTWSPDGLRIAYTYLGQTPPSPLHIVDLMGNSHRLTFTSYVDGMPSWSPYGNQIVYEREWTLGGVNDYLQLITLDNQYRVASIVPFSSRIGHNPGWSRDGTKIQ